ncbi:Fc.00g001450.m01.CDS01 [Cosmosporella sp. VM-42]
MPLCSRCRAFNIQAFAKNQFEYRGYPLEAFVRAAKDGCSFCSMLLEQFMAVEDARERRFLNDALGLESGQFGLVKWFSYDYQKLWNRWLAALVVPVWVNFSVTRGTELSSRRTDALNVVELNAFISPSVSPSSTHVANITRTIRLHVAAEPGTPASTSEDISGRLAVEKYTWSWAHRSAIQSWHQTCRENHPECAMTLSRSQGFDVRDVPLPSRCLEFFLGDARPNSTVPTCRWILRDTAGQKGKYVALSHRWNHRTENAKTTKGNINCRMARCASCCYGSPSGLSPLFEEAGILAASLGVKYIWIDSVCIIQDDPNDWKRESVKMAQYYQYAWITIAATTLSAAGGLFGTLTDDAIPSITRLPYMNPAGEQRGFFYVQCFGEDVLARNYKKFISKSSLLQRGWVFQEWMLSRRILAFSGAGLFVQCQQAAPRALIGDTVRNNDLDSNEPSEMTDVAFEETLKFDLSTKSTIHASWLKIVETYSGLGLTKLANDRLIALAGIAKEFGKALQANEAAERESLPDGRNSHRYISGTWFGHLDGLLWEQALTRNKPRVRVKGIPTWSWASMATRVVNDSGDSILNGMAVQWSDAGTEELCEMEKALTIGVEPQILEPLYHQSSTTPPEDEYSKDNGFIMLGLKGRVLPATIHGYFEEEDDATAAAKITAHAPNRGRDSWRRVTTGSQQEFITGWASVDHPDYQEDEVLRLDNRLCALFVSTIEKGIGGGLFGNWLGHYQTAFKVLFLKPVRVSGFGDCYERVGVGRLFGSDVEADFQSTTTGSIWLI